MTRLEITCHNGDVFEIEVEVYDPIAINEKLNNNELLTVVIGELVLSRIDIKRIIPVTSVDVE
ncbi:hypothetical protein [Caldifermentibacillus hisashii]|uniref:hypothetical protein n=1 Tax=Caldifermentibacillus hisashii TaxID=996558 RepID=UPI00344A7C5B